MSKLIQLSDELALPIDIVTMRVAIFGTSDAGKTTFARLVAERVHEAKQRFCAIDLKNDWWGLKSSADGSAAGIPIVIFGGPKRDIQIFEDAGAATADTVSSIEQSCVIDLDDFNKRKQLVFLTAFLNRLYDVNRKPLFLMADESDRYAPQQPGMDVAYESLGASEDICRRGRKRGIGSMWITQRNAVLNKSVSNMCDLTVVFRTPGSRDLKELKDSVGRIANEEQLQAVMKAAPGLDNGQVILLSAHPKLRKFMPPGATPLQMPMPWTFDSSATPKVGQRKKEPKVLAKTDLAAIEERMAKQVERAKADDPKELRKQIGILQRDLAIKAAECSRQFTEIERLKQSPGKPDPKQAIRATQVAKALRALEEAMKFIVEISTKNFDASVNEAELRKAIDTAVDQALAKIETIVANRSKELGELKKRADVLLARMKAVVEADIPVKIEVRHNEPFTVAPTPAAPPRSRPARDPVGDAGSSDLPPRRQRILDALLFFESIGYADAAREWIAFFCDTSPNSSTYEKDCSAMRSGGLVTYPSAGMLQLTDEGRTAARPTDAITLPDFHAKVERLLPPRRQKIMRALIEVYPEALRRDQLAEKTGTSQDSSTFEKDLSGMRTAGLLVYPQANYARAADLLFPPLPA